MSLHVCSLSDIDSFAVEYEEPIEALSLLSAVSQVQQTYGDSILRIKGILDLKGQEKPIVIHGVLGNLYPLSELREWPKDNKKSQLVFICRASVIEQIRHMFNELILNPSESTLAYYQQMIDVWSFYYVFRLLILLRRELPLNLLP